MVKLGAFATPAALSAPFLVITEAPLCAISIWVCGFSAIALLGTALKERATWLRRQLAFTTVVIATDAYDAAGKDAAAQLRGILIHGTRCEQLALPDGYDPNKLLQVDSADLEARLDSLWHNDPSNPTMCDPVRPDSLFPARTLHDDHQATAANKWATADSNWPTDGLLGA